jgi:hypothetical protein
VAAAAVLLAHIAAYMAFTEFRWPAEHTAWRESPSILVALNEEPPIPPPPPFSRPAMQSAPVVVLELPEIDPGGLTGASAITDWLAEGSAAAAGVAATDGATIRSFGTAERPAPRPRKAKPFGWDKTHTQRVEAMPGGGISIRLSDRCSLILAPLPLAGCSLGKIEARGDLFDGMKAPVEPGDWKGSASEP